MKDKTPETDEFETLRDAMNTSVHSDYFEALALCRKLEVERDEAREEAKKWRDNWRNDYSMSMIGSSKFTWEKTP